MMIVGLALMAVAPPAETAADAEARWVSFTLTTANQIRFMVSIDGRPATAILDTGATTSAVSRSFATAAGLALTKGAGALTISGRVANGWTAPHAIAFAGSTRATIRLAVADLPAVVTGGDPIDLLIGADMLARYALDIDYDARRFRLLPSGRLPFRGSIAPLGIGADWPFYVTDITIAGTRIGRVVIDTGDGTALDLSHGAAATLTGLPPATTTLDYAIGGATVVDLTALPELRSGTLTIRNIDVRIEPSRGFTETTGMSARIGSGLLRRYRVLLDPGAGRMVLAAGRMADRMPLRSTSGFLFAVRSDRLNVLHVMRGSPAERAGWRMGDAICTVDGIAITLDYAASPLAGWTVAPPGRTVRLSDCNGANRPITLARFY